MVFNSFVFLYFFALVYPLYLSLTHRAQNVLLLAASYVFYGWWDWRFLGLLLLTTAVDYGAGLGIAAAKTPRGRRAFLLLSVVSNLGMLGFFKYWDFFVDSFSALLESLGLPFSRPLLAVLLPAGISFYTFQSLSYVVDVYRGKAPAERNALTFALFVAFFPHLVAGPIMRAHTLLPQVARPRVVTGAMLTEGLWLLLFGYFKKAVVADNLAPFVQRMRHPDLLSGGELLVGLYCMAFFLYTDFAGYSDIARGLGKLLGFELTNNFRMPMLARNPVDFWRRWHITLSEWFRDYVFTPLVRLRAKNKRRGPYLLACAALTLVLCGLWHGAAWCFVVFGLWHALLLVGYYVTEPALARFWRLTRLPALPRRIVVSVVFFHLVSFAALFFLLPHPADWQVVMNGLLHGAYDAAAWPGVETLLAFVGPMALIELWQEASGDVLAPAKAGRATRLACYTAVFTFILLAGATETHAFVYFQF